MKFIRVHGRVVPIREKSELQKGDESTKRAVKGLIGGTIAGNAAGIINHASKRMTGEQFKVKYPEMFKAAGSPKIDLTKRRGMAANIFDNTIITGSTPTESGFLHEAGHLKMASKTGTMNNMFKRMGAIPHPLHPIGSPMHLVSEAEASGAAIKAAHKVGGLKAAAKIGAKLILPYGSYVGAAVFAASATGAAYHYAKYFTRKNKK